MHTAHTQPFYSQCCQPLLASSPPPQWRTGGFLGAQFYCLCAFADGNCCIQIRE